MKRMRKYALSPYPPTPHHHDCLPLWLPRKGRRGQQHLLHGGDLLEAWQKDKHGVAVRRFLAALLAAALLAAAATNGSIVHANGSMVRPAAALLAAAALGSGGHGGPPAPAPAPRPPTPRPGGAAGRGRALACEVALEPAANLQTPRRRG